jgi:hypothetical protein
LYLLQCSESDNRRAPRAAGRSAIVVAAVERPFLIDVASTGKFNATDP